MVDHVSREVRSKIMASVRSKGNALPRLRWAGCSGRRLCAAIEALAGGRTSGFRLAGFESRCLRGGCFWHGCKRCKYLPRSRVKFWRDKIEGNKRRDRRVSDRLRRAGWTVVRVRECAVRRESTLRKIACALGKARRAANVAEPPGCGQSRMWSRLAGDHFQPEGDSAVRGA